MFHNKGLPLLGSMACLLFQPCCGESDDSSPTSCFVRVSNVSDEAYFRLSMSWNGTNASFGSVPAGATSDYVEVPNIYRYGYVQLDTTEGKYFASPFDWVGEEPLPLGYYYTQVLQIDKGGYVGFTLVDSELPLLGSVLQTVRASTTP